MTVKRLSKQESEALFKKYQEERMEKFEAAKKALQEQDALDEDGYPTDAALDVIQSWYDPEFKNESLVEWMQFVKSIWHLASWGWHESEGVCEYDAEQKLKIYNVSTAGWSGNESVIRAMEQNTMYWSDVWVQSRRGGHYIFEIKV